MDFHFIPLYLVGLVIESVRIRKELTIPSLFFWLSIGKDYYKETEKR